MILLSLVIMYCIIFNEKSEKLVSTQTELDTAAAIQTSMVPSIPPAGEAFELHASMNTAKEVGGDFYDCFMIDSDRLFLYTDGVTEAHDPTNAQYGESRMNEVLEKTRQAPGDQVLDSMLEDIKAFSRGAPQFDDITMIVLTIKERQGEQD